MNDLKQKLVIMASLLYQSIILRALYLLYITSLLKKLSLSYILISDIHETSYIDLMQ